MDTSSDRQESAAAENKRRDAIPTVSRRLMDGSLIELVYDPVSCSTALMWSRDGALSAHTLIDLDSGEKLVPYSAENNLIATGAVLLPSQPEEYGTDAELAARVAAFIHRYVDLSPAFKQIATWYVMFTWVYDAFGEVPYLRLRGDYGTGKTRALIAIGSLCYKPFFASGASTVSPIFHTLDAFGGTLVLDEADFRFSDEKAEIVKILNNGNVCGVPVLRTMMNRQREFNPRAFRVFGPKIVATRGDYDDKALESRFLTEEMGGRKLRSDVPINLPDSLADEARELRNQLLAYRFARQRSFSANETLVDPSLEPRTNQVLVPLLSVIEDPSVRDAVTSAAQIVERNRRADRSLSPEAYVLDALTSLLSEKGNESVSVRDIAERFSERYGDEYLRPITNRWVGSLLRKLGLHTYKSHGIYVLPATQHHRIVTLSERFGIVMGDSDDLKESSGSAASTTGAG